MVPSNLSLAFELGLQEVFLSAIAGSPRFPRAQLMDGVLENESWGEAASFPKPRLSHARSHPQEAIKASEKPFIQSIIKARALGICGAYYLLNTEQSKDCIPDP